MPSSVWGIVSIASGLLSSASGQQEKYRIVQDRLFQSDFDKYLGELPFEGE